MNRPEPFNEELLDYPTAWSIQKRGGLTHHPRCSSVPGWDPISGPGLLCDCGAITEEYDRLKSEHQRQEKP